MSAELVGGTEGGTGAVPGTAGGGTRRYSVPEAARVLGISERAVRKRITTNTIAATRAPQGWQVELAAVPRAVPGPPWGGTAVPEGGTSAPVDAPGAVPTALVDELRHQRSVLEEQLAAMRQQLAAAEVERSELRRLLAAALQQRALPGPVTRNSEAVPNYEEVAPRPPWWSWARWRAWWRR